MSAEISRVLVTGASGYIATHVVQQLLKQGFQVRGTVRSLKNEVKVKPLRELFPEAAHPLELVEADLMDADSWDKAVEGCSHVLHTASPFPAANPTDPEKEIIQPAREGTLAVLRACHKHRVSRVVVTSSIAAVVGLGPGNKNKQDYVYSEKDWLDTSQDNLNAYTKSKALAEREAWKFVEQLPEDERFQLATICPGYVMGPVLCGGDATSLELPRKLMHREMPLLPKMYFTMCDVRDVAAAHINAMKIPEAVGNRHLIVCGEGFWAKDIAKIISDEFKSQGYSIPMTESPNIFVSFFGLFDKTVKMIIPFLGITQKVDNTRMRSVLGIEPTDMKKTILDMCYSMVDKGFIKRTKQYRGPSAGGSQGSGGASPEGDTEAGAEGGGSSAQ